MGKKSASGLKRSEQIEFLKDNGFLPLRSGKGSHEVWENPSFRMVAEKTGIRVPENLCSVRGGGGAGQVILPANPGGGTWNAISKYAKFCHEQVALHAARSVELERMCRAVHGFRDNANHVSQPQRHQYPAPGGPGRKNTLRYS